MTVDCPTCHAPVEFRFDDSFVRVCEHCHDAVLRTDRGVETLGKFADLAPIDSPLTLFAEGHDRGASFLLVGMAQLRHAQGGVWQEWYAKLDGGQWGWLSEAQGRFYMTYEVEVAAPAFLALGPGATVAIAIGGQSRDFTVGELGSASYASAKGEIPYRLVPGSAFRFADLAAADGTFLTIDYGDPGDPNAQPTVYLGHQMTLAELGIFGGEVAPPAAENRAAAMRIACPNCNGSLDVHAAGQTLRVACPYCGTMVSLEDGPPSILARAASIPKPDLPLGAKGTFAEGEMQIIGYLRRSALVDGQWWAFDEYLLYAQAIGFRWLVNSDGHWSYVQPIAPGAVEALKLGETYKYDGVKFRLFQASTLRVDEVLGEMYWRVTAGDVVQGNDYVAPPAMISLEVSGSEESWSLSSYLTDDDVRTALANKDLVLPPQIGVAPNQPARAKTASTVMSFGMVALLLLGVLFAVRAQHVKRWGDTITVPSAVPVAGALAGSDAAAPPDVLGSDADALGSDLAALGSDGSDDGSGSGSGSAAAPVGSGSGSGAGSGSGSGAGSGSDAVTAYFSPTFHLDAHQNIEVAFDASLDNDWAYVAADLVEDKTGTVIGVEADLEHYSGVDEGESWSEGDAHKTEMIGPVPAGDYIMRIESQHGGAGGASLSVTISQGIFRPLYLMLALLVLLVPYSIVGWVSHSHETKRWENSTLDDSDKPGSGWGYAFIGIRLLFVGIGGLISIISSSSSDD